MLVYLLRPQLVLDNCQELLKWCLTRIKVNNSVPLPLAREQRLQNAAKYRNKAQNVFSYSA